MTARPAARLISACGVAGALLLPAGCRNPFNPSSDIQLVEINTSEGAEWGTTYMEIGIYSNQVNTTPIDFTRWPVRFYFRIENKVGVTLRRMNVVYTDYDSKPVTVYGAAGRDSELLLRLDGIDRNAVGTTATTWTIIFYIIDDSVLRELMSPSYPPDKVMIANITFRGEDDNGYDVRLSGSTTIKGYGL